MRLFSTSPVMLCIGLLLVTASLHAQNRTTVQTFDYSNPARTGVFQFPDNPGVTYEKILMQYSMRCKNGLVSNSTNRNQGCGEWDYSCNTYITDSSQTDSLKAIHPDYIVSGFSNISQFDYSSLPTYTYYQYTQRNVNYTSVSNETIRTINTGTANTVRPLGSNMAHSKVQYMWLASELTAAGLTAGTINAMDLNITQLGNSVNYLRVKIKNSTKTELTVTEDSTGFRQVYFLNTTFAGTGNQRLKFYQPFTWDGTSNIIVEINYSNTPASALRTVGGTPSFNAAMGNTSDDYYVRFNGSDGKVNCGDIDALDNASQFTLEGWVFPNSLPAWRNIFEDNDQTVLQTGGNAGELYCIVRNPTNTYGYATNVLPLNKWTHVAMVYDGTQATNATRMKLYINGVQRTLTFNGTIPATTEDNNTPMSIADRVDCSMDDPRIWSSAVDAATIAAWMRRPVDNTHPNFSSLQAAYLMNEGSGTSLTDVSSFNRTGTLTTGTGFEKFKGNEILKNLSPLTERPNVGFVRGTFTTNISNVVVLDSVENLRNTVTQYQLVGGQPTAIATTFEFAATNQNVFDETGAVIRTIPSTVDNSFFINDLNYYSKSPQKVEIMSFVTPYGIGLNLGPQGKMWEFDVTDYAPILKGRKRISLERGGENQEEMDIKFIFIEGTPPRNVISMTQLWPVIQTSYQTIANNSYYEPRTLRTDANAAAFKMRSVITGHGQEGEFISRNHSINVNGGPVEFQWAGWKSCGRNPVYPQGGTWVYDRSGWCPGMASDIKEFNITNVQAGQTATFDYAVSTATGDSRYIASHQLIQYGAPNFTLDAAIVDLKAPTDRIENGRRNPACMNPIVRIQNTGSTTLTSLIINYGMSGQTPATFQWTGSLPFLGSTDVTIPVPDLGIAAGTFEVSCSNPNGGADQYANNNAMNRPYTPPYISPSRIIIEFKTNSIANSNAYTLKDGNGTVIKSRNGSSANTTYRDTVTLSNGCYEFLLTDAGNDGMEWWAAPNQGTGYIRFRNAATGAVSRIFNPDFGSETYLQFSPGSTVGIDESTLADETMIVYPNPSSSMVTIDMALPETADATLEIVDVTGRIIRQERFENILNASTSVNVTGFAKGMYFAVLKSDKALKTMKFVVD